MCFVNQTPNGFVWDIGAFRLGVDDEKQHERCLFCIVDDRKPAALATSCRPIRQADFERRVADSGQPDPWSRAMLKLRCQQVNIDF